MAHRKKKLGSMTPDAEHLAILSCGRRYPDAERREACKMGVELVKVSSRGSSLGKPPKVRIIRER